MQSQENHPAIDPGFYVPAAYRETVEEICAKQGCSVDEFISAAIADKLAHLAHLKWVEGLRKPTDKEMQYALELLRRPDSRPPESGDELPEGYVWPEL